MRTRARGLAERTLPCQGWDNAQCPTLQEMEREHMQKHYYQNVIGSSPGSGITTRTMLPSFPLGVFDLQPIIFLHF